MPEGVTSMEDLHDDEDFPVVDGEDRTTEEKEEEGDDNSLKSGNDPETDDTKKEESEDDDLDIPDIKSGETKEITDGIESFLEDFNILGGIVNIEDEEGNKVDKHFNDLSEMEKFNVLQSLSSKKAADIESKYDLQDSEIDILNAARNSKIDIKEYIEQLAQERVSQLSALGESTDMDYQQMSDDAVFVKFLKESEPNATEEDIAEELSNAKNGKLFKNTVDRLRENFVEGQEAEKAARVEADNRKRMEDLEAERSVIVNAVVGIDKVADWKVDDAEKNATLEKILEVNEYGDPVFMEEIFSDPEALFKAAWLFYNAEDKMSTLETYYKKEVGSAYRKGFDSAAKGMSPDPISGSRGQESKKPTPKGNRGVETPDTITWADLDDD